MNDLSISSGYDQPIPSPSTQEFLNRVEIVLEDSIKNKSAKQAIEVAKFVVGISQATGFGLMRLLYGLKEHWSKYEDVEQGEFNEIMASELGLSPVTVDRYIATWYIFDRKVVPDEYRERLLQRNLQELIPIGLLARSSYMISGENWKDFANAANKREIDAIVRNIKGRPPSASSIMYFLEKDGTLKIYNQGELKVIGYLAIHEEDEVIQAAIGRILTAMNVIRRE